jgi:S1-C subfamily serine protease
VGVLGGLTTSTQEAVIALSGWTDNVVVEPDPRRIDQGATISMNDDQLGVPGDDGVDYPMQALPLDSEEVPARPEGVTPWWTAAAEPADDPAVGPAPAGSHAARGGRARRVLVKVGGTGAAVILAAAASGVVVHHLDGDNTTTASATAVTAAAPVASVESALTKAEKSVVIINDTITTTSSSGEGGFGGGFGGQTYSASAAGTGIIITSTGEVVTNAHVVNGATNIKVTLPDGTVHSASILGMNTTKDLAVIKISGVSGLTPATFANSDTANVGESVIAIGNAEGYGGAPTVTEGILSAKNRSESSSSEGNDSSENLTGLLQTDAAINPGNSGGPLVDANGDVVGIDTAVATGTTSEPAQNIGFAIPANEVVSEIPSLEKGGTSSSSTSGSTATTSGAVLGVEVEDSASGAGATVEQVVSGSGAANAGLEAGDVITAVGRTQVTDADDLAAAIAAHKVGQSVKVTYTRNGVTKTTTATLGS